METNRVALKHILIVAEQHTGGRQQEIMVSGIQYTSKSFPCSLDEIAILNVSRQRVACDVSRVATWDDRGGLYDCLNLRAYDNATCVNESRCTRQVCE